jgi:hypothetical protein
MAVLANSALPAVGFVFLAWRHWAGTSESSVDPWALVWPSSLLPWEAHVEITCANEIPRVSETDRTVKHVPGLRQLYK